MKEIGNVLMTGADDAHKLVDVAALYPPIDGTVFATLDRVWRELAAFFYARNVPDAVTALKHVHPSLVNGSAAWDVLMATLAALKARIKEVSRGNKGRKKYDPEAIRTAYFREVTNAKPNTKQKDLYQRTADAVGCCSRTVQKVMQEDKRLKTLTPTGEALDVGLTPRRRR